MTQGGITPYHILLLRRRSAIWVIVFERLSTFGNNVKEQIPKKKKKNISYDSFAPNRKQQSKGEKKRVKSTEVESENISSGRTF